MPSQYLIRREAQQVPPYQVAAFLPPAFHQRWVKPVLLCAHSPLWPVAPGESPRTAWALVAGGSGPNLRPGEEKLPTAQAGTGHARDAALGTEDALKATSQGLGLPGRLNTAFMSE